MKKILLAIIAVCFFVTPASAFILNGGFETGTPDPLATFVTLNTGSMGLDNWSISGSIDYIGGYWQSAGGSTRSIDLAGNGDGRISQTFATVTGTPYRVTFAMAGNPDDMDKNKLLAAWVDTVLGNVFSFDTTGKNKTNMGWETKWFDFKASNSSTTLNFQSLMLGSPYGAALDNVSVSVIPIPAAAWLLGSGLIGLVLIRRRKGN